MKPFLKQPALLLCAAFLCLAVEPSGALFENDQVKVTRALERPHVKGKFHEHKPNRVMVYLQSGKQHFDYQDGRQPATFDWHAGQVVWSPAEGMHAPEVVSDEPFNIVEVELKHPGVSGRKLGALPPHAKLEFDNNQVRVFRLEVPAHKTGAELNLAADSVVIYMNDAPGHKMGDATWESAGSHTVDNNSDHPLEEVVVEVKG